MPEKEAAFDGRVYTRNVLVCSPFSRRVEAGFTAGQVSTDGGALLLREVDLKINLLGRLGGCFQDGRSPLLVTHQLSEMLSQRIYGLALGYEDLNDHEQLRRDPLLAVLSGKRNLDEELAGKSTLNRLELVSRTKRYHKISYSAESIDRLSTDEMKGNQLRLCFSALAYTLVEALRRLGSRAPNGPTHRSVPSAQSCSRSAPSSASVLDASCSRSVQHIPGNTSTRMPSTHCAVDPESSPTTPTSTSAETFGQRSSAQNQSRTCPPPHAQNRLPLLNASEGRKRHSIPRISKISTPIPTITHRV